MADEAEPRGGSDADAESEKWRRAGIRQAIRTWTEARGGSGAIDAGENHPRVRAYLEARGLDLARFPNGVVPRGIRFHGRCTDVKGDDGRWLTCPAMVASIVNKDGELQGVHKTYLDPGGKPEKRAPELGAAKKMRGVANRNAVRLGRSHPGGVLILTEGIETACACMTATGFMAWSALSCERLFQIELPEGMLAPRVAGSVHTIILAGDLNKGRLRVGKDRHDEKIAEWCAMVPGLSRSRAEEVLGMRVGEAWAQLGAERLRSLFPWVTVVVRIPGHRDCPELILPGAEAEIDTSAWDKSGVDWLDVLNQGNLRERGEGEQRVAFGLLDGIDLKEAGWKAGSWVGGSIRDGAAVIGGHGEDGGIVVGGIGGEPPRGDRKYAAFNEREMPVVEDGVIMRARRYLWERCRIQGGRRFGIARWAGEWWRWHHNGRGGGCYVKEPDEVLAAMVHAWLDGFMTIKRGAKQPLNPTPKAASTVVESMRIDTAVFSERVPAWVPPVINQSGDPLWGEAVARREGGGAGDAARFIVFPNGALDYPRLADRTLAIDQRVKLEPVGPELFNTTLLPFDLPVQALADLLGGVRARDEIFGELCPKFWWWLHDAADGDEEWPLQLTEMLGDTLRPQSPLQKIFFPVGQSGSGKGVIEDALIEIVGRHNMAPLNSMSFGDRHGLAHLIGKRYAFMGEGHFAGGAAGELTVETLKSLSGHNWIPVRDLYSQVREYKCDARIWITANDAPDLKDDSGALAARMVWLPMGKGKRISGTEDHTIRQAVAREAPGIMLLALEGLIRLLNKPRYEITLCAEAREMAESFDHDSAPLRRFVATWLRLLGDDELGTHPDGAPVVPEFQRPTCEDLYDAYCCFSEKEEGRRPLGFDKFFRRMRFNARPFGYFQPRAPLEGVMADNLRNDYERAREQRRTRARTLDEYRREREELKPRRSRRLEAWVFAEGKQQALSDFRQARSHQQGGLYD